MSIQLKKGVLDLCVLAQLRREATYGYIIYQRLSKVLDISESTIYPLLRRLVKQGYVETFLKPSHSGPARKYFNLTARGLAHYRVLMKEWRSFVDKIETLIEE